METASKELSQNGIIYYDFPLKADRYDFLYNHLDCDSIVELNGDEDERTVYIIARASSEKFNRALEKVFYEKGYEGKYIIMQGIDSKDVNSID